jgi:hypothetical protein
VYYGAAYADRGQYFDESPSDNVLFIMHLSFIKYLCETDIHNIYICSTYVGIYIYGCDPLLCFFTGATYLPIYMMEVMKPYMHACFS